MPAQPRHVSLPGTPASSNNPSCGSTDSPLSTAPPPTPPRNPCATPASTAAGTTQPAADVAPPSVAATADANPGCGEPPPPAAPQMTRSRSVMGGASPHLCSAAHRPRTAQPGLVEQRRRMVFAVAGRPAVRIVEDVLNLNAYRGVEDVVFSRLVAAAPAGPPAGGGGTDVKVRSRMCRSSPGVHHPRCPSRRRCSLVRWVRSPCPSALCVRIAPSALWVKAQRSAPQHEPRWVRC